MRVVIDADHLVEWLSSGEPPTVLDVRWQLGSADGAEWFRAAHIAGAQWVDLDAELAGPPGPGGRHPLPDRDVFAAALRRCGVSRTRRVVVVDDGSLLAAGRAWWMLVDAGHEAVYVLNGGMAEWQRRGLPVDVAAASPSEEGDFSPQPGHRRQHDTDEIALGTMRLWDVRAVQRYRGEVEPIDAVAGHIPGAGHLPTEDMFDDGLLVEVERLREVFAPVRTGDVVYCGSGITAARTMLALEEAGIDDVGIYIGSWSAWITDPDRPVA